MKIIQFNQSSKEEINDPESVVVLDHCPFCGHVGILQSSRNGYHGYCPICQTVGPKHPDKYSAGVLWNKRSIETILFCKRLDAGKLLKNAEDWTYSKESRELLEDAARNRYTKQEQPWE